VTREVTMASRPSMAKLNAAVRKLKSASNQFDGDMRSAQTELNRIADPGAARGDLDRAGHLQPAPDREEAPQHRGAYDRGDREMIVSTLFVDDAGS
jgi:hypothetical protein